MRAQALFDPGGTRPAQRQGRQSAPSWARAGDGDTLVDVPREPELRPASRQVSSGAEASTLSDGERSEEEDGTRGGEGTRGERLRLAVRERLPLWLQLRCGMERRSLVALAVVLMVAVAFAVQHFWTGEPRSVRAPESVGAAPATPDPSPGLPAVTPGSGAAGGTGGSGGQGASDGSGAPERIVVDVSGKVRRPGIHRLPAGARVADALKAAGGVRPGADTDGLNRARLLMDGEQVLVGLPQAPGPTGPSSTAGAAPSGGSAAGAAGGAAAGPIGLNTATAEQLDTLPGVGPVLAQHIIDYRTQHGGFRSIDELREVNGIGERRFADLKNAVRP